MGSGASSIISTTARRYANKVSGASTASHYTPAEPEEEEEEDDRPRQEEETQLQAIDLTGIENPGLISSFYLFSDNLLGRSADTLVRLSTHKATKRNRAIKQHSLKSQERTPYMIKQQVMLLRDVRAHPNIIRLHEIFEDKVNLYEILEYCAGGRIFDHIMETEEYHTEREAACVSQQVFKAVEYMHSRLVCHRDIKPEHVLVKEKGGLDGCECKVIDFSFAKEFSRPGHIFRDRVGTPYYCSPQVHQGRYTEICDIWACGVIVYLMLLGYPEDARSRLQTVGGFSRGKDLTMLLKGKFTFSPIDWTGLSTGVGDLLQKVLTDRETERPGAKAALSHEWLTKQAPQPLGTRIQIAGESCVGLTPVRTSAYAHQLIKQKAIKAWRPGDDVIEALEGPKVSSKLVM
eukprot:TRINITY_DN36790_c0_g1_i1.p1 TRINITY_DN36790_c0_g1~~TRINITY_DN36790_c0_g1_i1.p1  ORF type:complete len:414 (+),score=68.92 TRINITY_DN36790_c0_g1_i1:31-1242(+)